mmetsp:Transcript_8808/g.18837  ORF Transcript_8808/g.18837 Transcript_8808/m.18837 type:complete len:207 (-) Transcript_8808:103-723(-)
MPFLKSLMAVRISTLRVPLLCTTSLTPSTTLRCRNSAWDMSLDTAVGGSASTCPAFRRSCSSVSYSAVFRSLRSCVTAAMCSLSCFSSSLSWVSRRGTSRLSIASREYVRLSSFSARIFCARYSTNLLHVSKSRPSGLWESSITSGSSLSSPPAAPPPPGSSGKGSMVVVASSRSMACRARCCVGGVAGPGGWCALLDAWWMLLGA